MKIRLLHVIGFDWYCSCARYARPGNAQECPVRLSPQAPISHPGPTPGVWFFANPASAPQSVRTTEVGEIETVRGTTLSPCSPHDQTGRTTEGSVQNRPQKPGDLFFCGLCGSFASWREIRVARKRRENHVQAIDYTLVIGNWLRSSKKAFGPQNQNPMRP
jgi:hypothetical protein